MGADNPTSPPGCLHEYVRNWANTQPEADAVIGPQRRLSYAGLADAIDECSAALIAAGVERGDRVATLALPDANFLITFLAAGAVGAIWTGLNPRHTAAELDAVIERIEPTLVFASGNIGKQSFHDWVAALSQSIRTVNLDDDTRPGARFVPYSDFLMHGGAVERDSLEERCRDTHSTDPCLIVFTSGSTGTPKGVMISHASLIGASQVQLCQWPAEPLRVLVNLPINHIGCVGDLCCYTLTGGGAVVFTPRFEPAASLRAIRDEGVTVWGQVPAMFQLTLDAPDFDPEWLTSLQLIFWGGAHASPGLVARLRGLAPRIATSYGQTETVGSVTFTRSDPSSMPWRDTVGRAVQPYSLRIIDSEGHETDPGKPGEIQVRTPFGLSGYWRDPEKSAQAYTADGWQRTGDLGVLSPEGDLTLIGRLHDVFKSGGYNIYPEEIEAALEGCPYVDQAAVVGVPDSLWGHVGVAFVIAGQPDLTEDSLRKYLRDRLANYKIPKQFIFVDDLPRLPVGKVDKQGLKALVDTS